MSGSSAMTVSEQPAQTELTGKRHRHTWCAQTRLWHRAHCADTASSRESHPVLSSHFASPALDIVATQVVLSALFTMRTTRPQRSMASAHVTGRTSRLGRSRRRQRPVAKADRSFMSGGARSDATAAIVDAGIDGAGAATRLRGPWSSVSPSGRFTRAAWSRSISWTVASTSRPIVDTSIAI